jgi:poly(3-hydroxybutyrate) depolymerase
MAIFAALIGSACSAGDVDLGARGAASGGASSSSTNGGAGGSLGNVGSGGIGNAGGQGGRAAGGVLSTASGGATSPPASGGATSPPASGGATVMIDAGSGGSPQVTAGCGIAPPSSDTSLQVSGTTGSYILDLPTGYDNRRAYPVVMVFRGPNVTAAAFRSTLNLRAAAGADAIVVTPECLNGGSVWDVQRDVPLFDALLAHLESAYCVDPHRIFAVGHTAGGFFVNFLSCLRGPALRGIASLSAGPPSGMCPPGELAVWISQGNADAQLGIMNGRAGRDFWTQRNACDASMSTPVDPAPCIEYAACNPGSRVRYCEYNGDLGVPSFAAAGLWEFFNGL